MHRSKADVDLAAYEKIAKPWTAIQPWSFAAASLIGSDEALVIGKGPSFPDHIPERRDRPGALSMALNHAIEQSTADFAHVIDLEVFDQVQPDVWWNNCHRVVMPWRPHVGYKPTSMTLESCTHPVVRQLIADRRLCFYNLASANRRGYTAQPPGETYDCQTFSGEVAVRLLIAAGSRHIRTVGIDGGIAYAPEFSHLKPLGNGSPSFNRNRAKVIELTALR